MSLSSTQEVYHIFRFWFSVTDHIVVVPSLSLNDLTALLVLPSTADEPVQLLAVSDCYNPQNSTSGLQHSSISRMHDAQPPFVLGSTAVSSEDRCQRCGLAFEAGTGLRGFERGQLICDACTLEHAPREVAAALFCAAQARVARQVRPAHLERILGRAIAGGTDELCTLRRDEADVLAWALSGLYPHTSAVFEERRHAREAERVREAGRSLPEAGTSPASVSRLLAATLKASEPERLRARGIVEALADQPFAAQQAHLRAVEPRFKTPALCHLLTEESRRVLRDDPRRARELAELALGALDVLDPELLGEAGFHDLQADTYGWLANARRVASDFRAAEAAITEALSHLDRGSGQRLRQARILDFQGSLRRDQRRFDEALICLERALALYRAEGEPSQVAKMLINQGVVLHQAGESESAIPLVRQSLALIEPREHPRLVLSATHNLINCQCACQRYQEAQSLFPSARLHVVRYGQRADVLRLEWLYGARCAWSRAGGRGRATFSRRPYWVPRTWRRLPSSPCRHQQVVLSLKTPQPD